MRAFFEELLLIYCVLLVIPFWRIILQPEPQHKASEERGGKIEKERLSKGALVEELELKQDLSLGV